MACGSRVYFLRGNPFASVKVFVLWRCVALWFTRSSARGALWAVVRVSVLCVPSSTVGAGVLRDFGEAGSQKKYIGETLRQIR